MMKNGIKAYWPFIAAMVVYLVVTVIIIYIAIQRNDGYFVYPLDDTYIHMAIAKNVTLYRIWGITQYGFTSSTSSPLWTALLALVYQLFGISEIVPLVLNLIIGSSIIWSLDFLLRSHIPNPTYRLIILCVMIFATPLPTITFISMEHTLHGLLTLWFIYLAVREIPSSFISTRQYALLMTLSFFLSITRYEGLFAIFVVCVLLLLNKRWKITFLMGIAGIFPVTMYGLWSISNGWFFVPNSLLIKANTSVLHIGGSVPYTIRFMIYNFMTAPHILVLLILSVGLIFNRASKSEWDEKNYLNIAFVFIGLLQTIFAKTGWLFRYEGYLVTLGLFAISISVKKEDLLILFKSSSMLKRISYSFAMVLLVLPFFQRIFDSLIKTPQASTNIYEQQYQMAKFLKRFYPRDYIAINDIGAISYHTDVHVVDLFGLGSMESARAILLGNYSTEIIRDLAHTKDVKIAIVYENWYPQFGGLPLEWQKVGEWEVQNNVTLGDSIVAFLAVDPSEKEGLRDNLSEFAAELPKDIKQFRDYSGDSQFGVVEKWHRLIKDSIDLKEHECKRLRENNETLQAISF